MGPPQIIDLEGISSDLDDIRKEVATLRLCAHPNVLQYYVSFVEGRDLWLVTQVRRATGISRTHGALVCGVRRFMLQLAATADLVA